MTGIFTISYFPNILTVQKIMEAEKVWIEQHENFIKQSYRSRCNILGPNDILTLSVPVIGGRKNTPIRQILIDNRQRWQHIQWRSITSGYSKSPFFEHYEDTVKKVVFNNYECLFDLAIASMMACFEMLGIPLNIKYTEGYKQNYEDPFLDFRETLNKKETSYDADIFTPIPYYQNFGKLFAPNLSIMDLVFCEGPDSINILSPSTKVK